MRSIPLVLPSVHSVKMKNMFFVGDRYYKFCYLDLLLVSHFLKFL